MEKSSIFSANTLNALNNAPFEDLDAAEKRLSGWDFHLNYLKSKMTAEQLAVIAFCEQHSAAVIAAAVREVNS